MTLDRNLKAILITLAIGIGACIVAGQSFSHGKSVGMSLVREDAQTKFKTCLTLKGMRIDELMMMSGDIKQPYDCDALRRVAEFKPE